MIKRSSLATALLALCLVLAACGDDEPEITPAPEPVVVEPTGVDAATVSSAASSAVALLGERAPAAVWELFADGNSVDEVIAAIEDGSIADLTGSASTTRFASTQLVELDPASEAEFDAFMAEIQAEIDAEAAADEHFASVVAQVILHGQGYTVDQINEAVAAGNLVLVEQDPYYCFWTTIEGFPSGSGFSIPGVTPIGTDRFAGQECPELVTEDDPEGETVDPEGETGEGASGEIEVGPPASGTQASMDCGALEPPAGVDAEVNLESSAAEADESGFIRDVRCNFFLSNEDGARAGMAINIGYFCAGEASNRIADLGSDGDRSRVSGMADTFRQVEISDSPIQSNAGEFFTQDKLFSKLGSYAVLTLVLNTDEGFASTDFIDMSKQLAAQMHPPLAGALDYC